MKKIICICIFFVFQVIRSQEDKPSFQFKSFSVTALEAYFNSGRQGGGASISSDLSFLYGKHIFSISGGLASEVAILDARLESAKQLNLLYGRDWNLDGITHIELHGGAGYFFFKVPGSSFFGTEDEIRETIGFPVVLKIRFRTGPRFSLGFRVQRNFNSANDMLSVGFILQWNRFNKN